jgi:hypothetical protein
MNLPTLVRRLVLKHQPSRRPHERLLIKRRIERASDGNHHRFILCRNERRNGPLLVPVARYSTIVPDVSLVLFHDHTQEQTPCQHEIAHNATRL